MIENTLDYFVGASMTRSVLRDHIGLAKRALDLIEDQCNQLEAACEHLRQQAGEADGHTLLDLDFDDERKLEAHRAMLAASLTRLARELQTTAEML